MQIEPTTCCGLKEASGLCSAPAESVFKICDAKFVEHPFLAPFVFFTDNIPSGRGIALAKFIRDNAFGDLIETKETYNPNSRNTIIVWVWAMNDKCKDWYASIKEKMREDMKTPIKAGDMVQVSNRDNPRYTFLLEVKEIEDGEINVGGTYGKILIPLSDVVKIANKAEHYI